MPPELHFTVTAIAIGVGLIWMAATTDFGPTVVLAPALAGFVITQATDGEGLLRVISSRDVVSPGGMVAAT